MEIVGEIAVAGSRIKAILNGFVMQTNFAEKSIEL